MDDGIEMVLRQCDECRERPAVVLRYCARCALEAIGTAPVQALAYVEALMPKGSALTPPGPWAALTIQFGQGEETGPASQTRP